MLPEGLGRHRLGMYDGFPTVPYANESALAECTTIDNVQPGTTVQDHFRRTMTGTLAR
jgi:hypothetical protein